MIQGYVTSAIRTLAAYAVAWLLSLKLAGPVLDFLGAGTETARERLTALLVFVLGTVYYLLARALEEKWPALGSLLGVPSRPSYAPAQGAHAASPSPAADPDGAPAGIAASDGTEPPDPTI